MPETDDNLSPLARALWSDYIFSCFGPCIEEGTLDLLPFEAACHAFDEYFDGQCNEIAIRLEPEGGFTLRYNAGVSLVKTYGYTVAESIMTQIMDCSNKKKHLEVGAEFCRIGLAIINGAMSNASLTTVCKGKLGVFSFIQGKTHRKKVVATDETVEYTELFMQPDPKVFEDLRLTYEGVKQKADDLTRRLSGLTITVTH